MPWLRRLHRARLHPTTLAQNPSPSAQTHPVSLTTAELQYVLTRRLRNDYLPDDPHTLFAERITSIITMLSSFCAKIYLLERTPLVNLPTTRPRLAFLLRILALSQLRPLRILTLPLIRFFRPLSWLLAPFAAMSLPVAVHVIAKYVIRQLTPTPPPRPEIVDHLIERAAEVCEKVTDTVNRASQAIENDLQHILASPPQLPSLADIVPAPLSHFVTQQTPQPHSLDTSNLTPPAPPEEDTVIRSPVPTLRRPTSPVGLSALTGSGTPSAGITVSSTARSQRALSSELNSEAGSETAEEKSWWYKASS